MSNASKPRKRNRKPGAKSRRHQAHDGNPRQRQGKSTKAK